MRFLFARVAAPLVAFFAPALALAHEVYVLTPDTTTRALATPHWSELAVIARNLGEFTFWAFIAGLIIFVVFFVSIIRPLERWLDPFLARLTPYAPAVSRITVGLAFLAAAHYGALFGPELPLSGTFAGYETSVEGALVVIGLMIVFGFYTRIAALAALAFFGAEIAAHGWYLLTYANYFGELVLLLILGAHKLAFHHQGYDERRAPDWLLAWKRKFTPYAFLILRVGFGVSLLFASLYAKIFYNNLALSVAYAYPPLVRFFGFEPHFLVLGAALIEILIALFFILGVEIRFTSLFLLFWLSLSLWYFGEVVWPHIILIGIPVAFIFYGYDAYSLEGWYFKRGAREPVL